MAVIGAVEFDVRLNRENLDRQLSEIGRKAVDIKANVTFDSQSLARHRQELERSFKKDFCISFKFCDDSIRREKARVRREFNDFCIPLKFCDDSIQREKERIKREMTSLPKSSKTHQRDSNSASTNKKYNNPSEEQVKSLKPDIHQLNSSVNEQSQRIASELKTLKKEVIVTLEKTSSKKGIVGTVFSAALSGFFDTALIPFSSKVVSAIERRTQFSTKNAGERSGKFIGEAVNTGKKAIDFVFDQYNKNVVQEVSKDIDELISDAFVEALDISLTPQDFVKNFASIISSSQKTADALNTLNSKLTNVNTHISAIGINTDPKKSILQSPIIQSFSRSIAPQLDEFLQKRRSEKLSDKAKDLVAQRAREIIETNFDDIGRLTPEEIEKGIKKAEKLKGRTIKNPNTGAVVDASVLAMGKIVGVSSLEAVTPETKELIITIGGYAGAQGAGSGMRIAGDITYQMSKMGRKEVAAIGLTNPDTDLKPEAMKQAQTKMMGLLGSLSKPNIRGYNKDAIEMASQAMAAILVSPDIKVKLLGESGGGFVAEEATELLRLMGFSKNVEGAGFGTPSFIGGFDLENYTKFLGKDPLESLGFETHNVYAPMGLADVSQSSQNLTGLTGHPYEHYAPLPEFQSFVYNKNIQKQKVTISQSELKAIKAYIQDINTIPLQGAKEVKNYLKNLVDNLKLIEISEGESEDISSLVSILEKEIREDELDSTLTYRDLLKKASEEIAKARQSGDVKTISTLFKEIIKIRLDLNNTIIKSDSAFAKQILNQYDILARKLKNIPRSPNLVQLDFVSEQAEIEFNKLNESPDPEKAKRFFSEIDQYIKTIESIEDSNFRDQAEPSINSLREIRKQLSPVANPSETSENFERIELPPSPQHIQHPSIDSTQLKQLINLQNFLTSDGLKRLGTKLGGSRTLPADFRNLPTEQLSRLISDQFGQEEILQAIANLKSTNPKNVFKKKADLAELDKIIQSAGIQVDVIDENAIRKYVKQRYQEISKAIETGETRQLKHDLSRFIEGIQKLKTGATSPELTKSLTGYESQLKSAQKAIESSTDQPLPELLNIIKLPELLVGREEVYEQQITDLARRTSKSAPRTKSKDFLTIVNVIASMPGTLLNMHDRNIRLASQVEQQVERRAAEIAAQLPDLQPGQQDVKIGVAGFAGDGGKSSVEKAEQLKQFISPEDKSLILHVDNPNLDSEISAITQPLEWTGHVLKTVLRKGLIEGVHKDAIELAATMKAARERYGNIPITAFGHSGGGFIVQDALQLLKESRQGIDDQMRGVTLGTPRFGFSNANPDPNQFKSFAAIDDHVINGLLPLMAPHLLKRIKGRGLHHASANYFQDRNFKAIVDQFVTGQTSGIANRNFETILKEAMKVSGSGRNVTGRIPQLIIDNARLQEEQAEALYDTASNQIIINEQIATLLASSQLDIKKNNKKLIPLIHEIEHAIDYDFGQIGTQEAARQLRERSAQRNRNRNIQPTQKDVATATENVMNNIAVQQDLRNVMAEAMSGRMVEPGVPQAEIEDLIQLEAQAYAFERQSEKIVKRGAKLTIRERIEDARDGLASLRQFFAEAFDQTNAGRENIIEGLKQFETELIEAFPRFEFLEGATEKLTEFFEGGAAIAVGITQLRSVLPVLKEMASSSLEVANQFQALRVRLNALGESSEEGSEMYQFAKKLAISNRIGLAGSISGYTQLVATAKNTALEGEPSEKIQQAISQASLFYGLSDEQIQGSMTAINQIAGKGAVSMEELRGQLSERLPGAFQIAARSMGMTTQEFTKLVSLGQVAATDFLPKFADQLIKETAGGIESSLSTAIAAQSRYKNAVTELQAEMGKTLQPFQSGALNAIAKFLQGIASHGEALGKLFLAIASVISVKLIGAFWQLASTLKIAMLGGKTLAFVLKAGLLPTLKLLSVSLVGMLAVDVAIRTLSSAYDTFFSKTKSATWSAQLQSDLKSSREELAKLRAEIDKANQPKPAKPQTAFSKAKDELKEEQKNRTLAQKTGRFLFGGISDLINPNSDNNRLARASGQTIKEERELKALQKNYEQSVKPELLEPVNQLILDEKRINQIKKSNEQIFKLRQQSALAEDAQEQERIKKQIGRLRQEQNILDLDYGSKLESIDSQIAGREEALKTAQGDELKERLELEIKELKKARDGLADAITKFGGDTDISRLLKDLIRVRLEIETLQRITQESESTRITAIAKDQLDELKTNPLASVSADIKKSESGLKTAQDQVKSAKLAIQNFKSILADPIIEQYAARFENLNLEQLKKELEGVDEKDIERRTTLEALIGLREQESGLIGLQRTEAEALLQLEQQRSQAALRRIQFEMEKRQIETQRIEVEDTTGLINEQLKGRMKLGEADVRRAQISHESAKRREQDINKEIQLIELAKRRGELTAEDYHQKMLALEGQRLGAVQQSAETQLSLRQANQSRILSVIEFEARKTTAITKQQENEKAVTIKASLLSQQILAQESEEAISKIRTQTLRSDRQNLQTQLAALKRHFQRREIDEIEFNQRSLDLEQQLSDNKLQIIDAQLQEQQAIQSRALAKIELDYQNHLARIAGLDSDRVVDVRKNQIQLSRTQSNAQEVGDLQVAEINFQTQGENLKANEKQLADLQTAYVSGEITKPEFMTRERDLIKQIKADRVGLINAEISLINQREQFTLASLDRENNAYEHAKKIREGQMQAGEREFEVSKASRAISLNAIRNFEDRQSVINQKSAKDYIQEINRRFQALDGEFKQGLISKKAYIERFRQLEIELSQATIAEIETRLQAQQRANQRAIEDFERTVRRMDIARQIAGTQGQIELRSGLLPRADEVGFSRAEQEISIDINKQELGTLAREYESLKSQIIEVANLRRSGAYTEIQAEDKLGEIQNKIAQNQLNHLNKQIEVEKNLAALKVQQQEIGVRARQRSINIESAMMDESVKREIEQRAKLVGFARAEEEFATEQAKVQLEITKTNFAGIKQQIREVKTLREIGALSEFETQERLGDLEVQLAQNRVQQITQQAALQKAIVQERTSELRRESELIAQQFEMIKNGLNTEQQLRQSRVEILKNETAELQKQKEILDQQIQIVQSLNNFSNTGAKGGIDKIGRTQGYIEKIRDIQSKIKDGKTDSKELQNLKQQLSTYKELAGLGSGSGLVNESQIAELIKNLQNQKGQEETNLINARMDQNKQQEAFENRQLERQQILNELASQSNILAAKNAIIQAEIALNTAKQAENKARFNYLEAQATGDPNKIAIASQGLEIAQEGVRIAETGVTNAINGATSQQRIADLQRGGDQTLRDKQFVEQQLRRQGLNIEAETTEERLAGEAVETLGRGGTRNGLQTRFNAGRLQIDKKGLRGVRNRSESYFDQELSSNLPNAEDILRSITSDFEASIQSLFGENIFQRLEQDALVRSLGRTVERAYQYQEGGMQSNIQPEKIMNTASLDSPPTGSQLTSIQSQLDKIHSVLSNSSSGVQNLTVVSNDPAGDSRQVLEDWMRYKNYNQ